jgi:hypothetical protein
VTYADLRVRGGSNGSTPHEVASAVYRGVSGHAPGNTDCTCEFTPLGELVKSTPSCPASALESIITSEAATGVIGCAVPFALPPPLPAPTADDDAQSMLRQSVAAVPLVSGTYYDRAQGDHPKAKAMREVKAVVEVKGGASLSVVPLVFGDVGMPEVWRGEMGDALGHASGVSFEGGDAVFERSMGELEERLRGMGIAPRGEAERLGKEKKAKEAAADKEWKAKEEEEVKKWERVTAESKAKGKSRIVNHAR